MRPEGRDDRRRRCDASRTRESHPESTRARTRAIPGPAASSEPGEDLGQCPGLLEDRLDRALVPVADHTPTIDDEDGPLHGDRLVALDAEARGDLEVDIGQE